MPVQERVVEALTRSVIGDTMYVYGVPDGMTKKEYDLLAEMLEDMYLQIVDKIDWARTLLVAQGQCERHKHKHSFGETVCGPSLMAALTTMNYGSWSACAEEPKRPKNLDWPLAIAKALRYRKPSWRRKRN